MSVDRGLLFFGVPLVCGCLQTSALVCRQSHDRPASCSRLTSFTASGTKKYNLEGHAHFLTFSCHRRMALLTNDTWRAWLAEAVRAACDKHCVALWAYVFMPEHVHVLLKPRKAVYDLAAFEHSLKLAAARRILFSLSREKSPLLEKLRVRGRGERPAYRFWQPGGGHDLNIWTMQKAVEKAEYCHWNPVKRRLVKAPEHWRWSSFRWLMLGRQEGEPLQVDPWDETILADETGSALLCKRPQSSGTHTEHKP